MSNESLHVGIRTCLSVYYYYYYYDLGRMHSFTVLSPAF